MSTPSELPGELPIDSDLESTDRPERTTRPVHMHWRYLGLVFVGGSVGTAARYFLTVLIPDWHGLPISTFIINISGAFILGVLLEALALRGPDEGTRRALRLLLGTGVLGGYTTYSAFAVGADGLIISSQLAGGVVYAVATILVGAAASIAGIGVSAAIGRRRRKVAAIDDHDTVKSLSADEGEPR